MASSVSFTDLELWLTNYFRGALTSRPELFASDVEVDNKEPAQGKFPSRLLVVRVDSGDTTSVVTKEIDVGLSVLAGTKEKPKDANDLILLVEALAQQAPFSPLAGNPVAAVLESRGPFVADENQQRARRYITVTLAVVGRPFD